MNPRLAVRLEIGRAGSESLVIKNDRTTPLTLIGLREPARQARVTYAPTSAFLPGEKPLATTWQQATLGFDVAARDAASEVAAQAAVDDLAAALLPLSVPIHIFFEGGFERVWTCHGGSLAPADRDYVNLINHDPVWTAAVPCHPIPIAP